MVTKLNIVPKYSAQVVELLTEMLEQAKRGELVELTCTARCDNGEYLHNWTGCENLMELVGILERQKMATLRRMDQ
jgi:hypothetical protein